MWTTWKTNPLDMKMKTRKTHRKSRYGCETCKKRHVKCDEKRPQCDKCISTLRRCSYLGTEPRTPSVNNTPGAIDSNSPSNWNLCTGFTLLDLSLLHQFSTSTCRTLSTQRSLQRVWGTTIVQISFTHPFLLHGILSLAALHRAFTPLTGSTSGPETDSLNLINYAIEHQSIALTSFQAALAHPNRGQADALFALSIVTFTYTMAMARETPEGEREGEVRGRIGAVEEEDHSNILHFGWIRMARGIRMVVFAHMDWIKEGCLRMLLTERRVFMPEERGEEGEPEPEPWWDADRLKMLWADERGDELVEGEKGVYEETLGHLEDLHRVVRVQLDRRSKDSKDKDKEREREREKDGGQPTFAAVFRWLIDIPEAFIEFVEQHRPVALILLAHYASISARMRHMWWSEQSGQLMIKRVRDLLDPKWHGWMEYPLQHL